jgi:predicted GTPase
VVQVNHPTTSEPIILVDTPGFDNSDKQDTEILTLIADWIAKM